MVKIDPTAKIYQHHVLFCQSVEKSINLVYNKINHYLEEVKKVC